MSATDTLIDWGNAGIRLRLAVHEERAVVVNLGPTGHLDEDIPARIALPPAEVLVAGGRLPQGQRHVWLGTSTELRYVRHETAEEHDGARLDVVQQTAAGLEVVSRFRTYGDLPVLRVEQLVTNRGSAPLVLEYLASLSVNGFIRFRDPEWRTKTHLRIPHNTLLAEFQWADHLLTDLGIIDIGTGEDGVHSSKSRVSITSVGTQPTTQYLPMGALEDHGRDVTWAWQIETNGSWQWEVADHLAAIYVSASGPTDQEHHWHRELAPGETFEAAPLAFAATPGRLEDALVPLTSYRRLIRRPNEDDVLLPVVFNDFMNSLMADPDEEKLPPVIAAAAAIGADYFCVDAGWYADEQSWWNTVGQWEESSRRFPSGFAAIFDRIRAAGMRPGLWLEPEVMGVESDHIDELPDEAYFRRHGARIDSQGRHQLDFRSPAVRERMDAVVDRLIADYGLEYLKFDYNINGGIGTDHGTSSAGDALLEHNRAFLDWIRGIFARHPGLVIENCSSGGARIDYASMREYSILSTSDQWVHTLYAPIAAGAPSGVTSEQAAVWVTPLPSMSDEDLRFAVVNGLLARPQFGGRPWELSPAQLETVAEGIRVYRGFNERIPGMTPVWPLGLPGWYDEHLAQGLVDAEGLLLNVWRRGGDATVVLPLAGWARPGWTPEVLYPVDVPTEIDWDGATLRVTLPAEVSARTIRIG